MCSEITFYHCCFSTKILEYMTENAYLFKRFLRVEECFRLMSQYYKSRKDPEISNIFESRKNKKIRMKCHPFSIQL